MKTNHCLPSPSTIATSAQWCAYYRANAASLLPIPWERGAEMTPQERAAIGDSLAAWQLGETSDGAHLLAAARNYAERIHDPEYVEVIRLFIREEQRHGNNLGQFLDLAGIPRLRRNWGDTLFRWVRYALPSMDIWTTPVIMVETLAMVYYNAIRKATDSEVLQRICQQILRDEIKHIRFQYERLAILYRARPSWVLGLTFLGHRVLFAAIAILVWAGHQRALRAGGHDFASYWREAWRRMRFAWERMHPDRYREKPILMIQERTRLPLDAIQ